MLLTLPETLPIARYRFTFRIQRDLHLPTYAGSTLRGVFGHALINQICTCGQKEQHTPSCPYSSIFSTPRNTQLDNSQQNTPPQPYVFEPSNNHKTLYRVGEDYTFNMVLFGQVRVLLPLIVSALKYAFAQGVGSNQGQGELIDLSVQNHDTWHNI